jgi:HK97 family phage portal protein
MFSSPAKSGVSVTHETAMQHTAVYACVKILCEAIASLPLHLYESYENGGRSHKRKAAQHSLYDILMYEPNQEMTAYTWKYVLMMHLSLRGKHFSQIIRNRAGKVVGIYPLQPERMSVVRLESGKISYVYRHMTLGDVPLYDYEVLHFLGMSEDGITSMSPIEYNRNSIGLSIAMEEFGSTYFKNGANGGGVLHTDQKLSDEAFHRLKTEWAAKYSGLVNANKPIILEEGLKWEKLAISNEDSQFLQSRKYTKAEIASIFRVPLHMINELDKATFSNIEHQSMQFVIDSMRPTATNIEQEIRRKLLSPSEKKRHYVRFNLGALLRGDTKTRYEAYESAISKACWMTRNEARELEDLNPIDGLDEIIVPLNYAKDEKDATK